MSTKTRIIVVSVLILLGGVLFGYCAALYPTDNANQLEAGSATVCDSQLASVEATPECDSEDIQSDSPKKTASAPKPRPRSGAT